MMTLQKNKTAAKLFAQIVRFSGWLQNLPNKMTPPPFRLIQIGSAFWQSRSLYVASRLNIASVLADKTLSAEEIADKVSAQPDAINRLLRFLVSMGIFEQVKPKYFRNNKTSAYLREDNPKNVRAMILMHNSPEMSQPWYEQLEAGIKTGEVPFKLAHHEELFDYTTSHPEFGALFNNAMHSVEALSGDSYAVDFDWSQFSRIFDVGGGIGSKTVTILRKHPQLRAEVIDAAAMIQDAKQYWQDKLENQLLQRMSFSAGDVLESVPAAKDEKDIYFLSAVLHGLDDAACIKALRNIARASAGTGARTAVLEMVMDAEHPDSMSSAFDMQMLMGTHGRERSLPEWESLFNQSDLHIEEVVGLRSFGRILVARA